jgi:hypothetical protein
MTKYLISFPAAAMDVPAEELSAVGAAARPSPVSGSAGIDPGLYYFHADRSPRSISAPGRAGRVDISPNDPTAGWAGSAGSVHV